MIRLLVNSRQHPQRVQSASPPDSRTRSQLHPETIYERLRPKEEADTSAEDGRPADRGSSSTQQSQINEEPVPLTISEAWKIGLQGTHPSRVSRLRARAATPIITPRFKPRVTQPRMLSRKTISR
ncbi:hypothetical protein Pst134EA_032588 [Puccinia striiformis f. sp. tritici]|uniref:uncharacterized protein n=1 Tax=Puccinia striiformis f. sp. tritici TaxID=168172 RepID=UPI002007257B|nr:uncharacterized protein Pst134EA_032588 [Puccinia striiformis f. sp. tritici]KAH9443577.1 hypothetical protein Pst134EA_032588 [Puccinia striiformis f. sp. tritici]